MPLLRRLKRTTKVNVRPMPNRHIVAVLTEQQQLVVNQALNSLFRRARRVYSRNCSAQQIPRNMASLTCKAQAQQACGLQSLHLFFRRRTANSCFRLKVLPMRAAGARIGTHGIGEIVVDLPETDRSTKILLCDKAENGSLVLRNSCRNSRQDVQRHRMHRKRGLEQLMNCCRGDFLEKSLRLRLAGKFMQPPTLRGRGRDERRSAIVSATSRYISLLSSMY